MNRIEEAKQKDESEEQDVIDDENVSVNESVTKLQQAIRLAELLGQVVKNHGEIRKPKIMQYYLSGMNMYRRICTFFISNFKMYQNDFLKYVENYCKDKGVVSHSDISRKAYKAFASLNFISISSTVFRVSESLTARHLVDEIVKPILTENDNPMVYCIYLHGFLWYKKEVPFDELKNKIKDFPDTMKYLVKSLLCDYTDKHRIEQKYKQKIASALDMNVKALDYDVTK